MKDLWTEVCDRLANFYEEQGMGEDEARALAEAEAHDGDHLDLNSLTSIPEGVTLSAGGYLYLRSLTSIPEGFL